MLSPIIVHILKINLLEILKNHIFEDKHIEILLKPVKLIKIETCMFDVVYKDKDSIIPHLTN